jgi:hypothetical protein
LFGLLLLNWNRRVAASFSFGATVAAIASMIAVSPAIGSVVVTTVVLSSPIRVGCSVEHFVVAVTTCWVGWTLLFVPGDGARLALMLC